MVGREQEQARITFRFSGRIADHNELSFYEAGRFQYGAARLIYGVEKFRQTNTVVKSLQTRVGVDLRVGAPREGSFIQDILIYSAPIVADCAIKVPLEVLVAHVFDLLIPPSHGKEVALKIAQEHTKQVEAREKTAQAQAAQSTTQIEAISAAFAIAAQSNNATVQQALEIIKNYEAGKISLNNDLVEIKDGISEIRKQFESEITRKAYTDRYQVELDRIDRRTEAKLVRQMRKAVPDIGMPLKRSADFMYIFPDGSEKEVATLHQDNIKRIVEEVEDPTPTSLLGDILSYDKSTGIGKFRYAEVERPLSFRVPGETKKIFRDKILEAMKTTETTVSFYIVRDRSGLPLKLIFNDIV